MPKLRTRRNSDIPFVMGVLNVTPDSFSDGGQWIDQEAAVNRALEMLKNGADVIDIGGESTRPGAAPVPDDEELRRVIPVIKALRERTAARISIDTFKPNVARAPACSVRPARDLPCRPLRRRRGHRPPPTWEPTRKRRRSRRGDPGRGVRPRQDHVPTVGAASGEPASCQCVRHVPL